MIIFDYDKYIKVGFGFDWANGCKNHRVKRGFTISDNGKEKSMTIDWISDVPDFMVGDRVVIKTWEQMETEYGVDKFGVIYCKNSFVKGMRNLCGKKATITKKDGERIWLTFDDKKTDSGWSFSTDMIELAYPTVRGCEVKEKVNNPTYTTSEVKYLGQTAKFQYDDRFDLEKGIMLCMLQYKGITYSDIRKAVDSAEKVVEHKFNVGDIVRVVDNGKQYDRYFAWFDEQKKPELKKKYGRKCLLKGKELRVIHFGEHSYFTDTIVYACEDLKGNIYLMGERGLEKAED